MSRHSIKRTEEQIRMMTGPAQRDSGRQKRAIAEPSTVHGVRPDRTWRQPGIAPVRPELTNHDLIDAIEWMHVNCGRNMTAMDAATLDELGLRAWTWTNVNHQRLWVMPSWADELIPKLRSTGYARFLAIVLAAYRSGACGVLLAYHDCMALADIESKSTWRRWTLEMEELGLIRIVQTWKPDPVTGRGRARCHDKLLYRLGPAWEALAGPGLCEDASRDGEVSATWAGRMATGARKKARETRNARRTRHWKTNANDPRYARAHGLNIDSGSTMIGEHSPPTSEGVHGSHASGEGEQTTKARPMAVSLQATQPASPVEHPATIDPTDPETTLAGCLEGKGGELTVVESLPTSEAVTAVLDRLAAPAVAVEPPPRPSQPAVVEPLGAVVERAARVLGFEAVRNRDVSDVIVSEIGRVGVLSDRLDGEGTALRGLMEAAARRYIPKRGENTS